MPGRSRVKVVCFLLPQFHAIPENDAWWGEGFTDWVNVRKARPRFPGHHQPREPQGGRYYDLLDPAVRAWQAGLARSHGVHAFCYYHYWFGGKLLLERPAEQVLASGEPDFPFCLCWANEPWTRAWDGLPGDVLMPQEYGGEPEWERHIAYLLPFFRDPRYLRVDGRPVFVLYRAASVPRCDEMLRLFERRAREAGLPGLHLVKMLTAFDHADCTPPFDAQLEFEPQYTAALERLDRNRPGARLARFVRRVRTRITGPRVPVPHASYEDTWRRILARPLRRGPLTYPGAFVDWDNSARRAHGAFLYHGATTELFGRFLTAQLRKAREAGAELLFVNAWNEWAEGAYLEPDERHGLAWLRAVQSAVDAIGDDA